MVIRTGEDEPLSYITKKRVRLTDLDRVIGLESEKLSTFNLSLEGEIKALAIGNFLNELTNNQLAVGTESGKVYMLAQNNLHAILNPMSGPISSLAFGHLTRTSKCDLVAGDIFGRITVFSNSQSIAKLEANQPILSLGFALSPRNEVTIMAGSVNGYLSAYQLDGREWRRKVNQAIPNIDSNLGPNTIDNLARPILQIFPAIILNVHLQPSSYCFLIDGSDQVQVFCQNQPVAVLRFPNPICWVCQGQFDVDPSDPNKEPKLLFGSSYGYLFTIDPQFNIHLYMKVPHPLTKILPFRPLSPTGPLKEDVLVLAGPTSTLHFYHRKAKIHQLEMSTLVTEIATGNLSQELASDQPIEGPDLVVALSSGRLEVYSFKAL